MKYGPRDLLTIVVSETINSMRDLPLLAVTHSLKRYLL